MTLAHCLSRHSRSLFCVVAVAASPMGIRAFATQTAVGTPVPGSMSVYKVSSASGGQDIWPFATQSDPVGFEGGDAVLRGGGGVFVDLFHNTPRVYQLDIALPCNGPGVTVARSFNGVQVPDTTSPGTIDISGSRRDSDGYQGYNWFQGRPELVKSWAGTGAGSSADDRLYLITGADTALEFKRDGTGTTFVGVNGTQAAIVHTADGGGSPGLYEYRDLSGTVMTFFDFDGDAYGAAGQLWKTRDMDGASGTHTSYIGHASTIATALAAFEQSGGHPTARPTTIYDAAGRRYTYAYSTFGGKTRLSQVKAERYISSAWTEITRVDYDYYTSTSSGKGVAGDLKTSTTTTPLSSGGDDVRVTYYRYYTAAYSSPSNPGHPHQLKLVVSAEALRQYGAGYESETDSNLQSYASGYFTYGSDCRLATALFNGECGCSGGGMGGNGTYTLSLEANANFSGSWSDGTYDCSGNWTGAQWALRTTITTPDSHKIAHYFDEAGQPLGKVLSSANDFSGGGNKYWITKYNRDASGRIVAAYTPAVFSGGGYTHTTGGGTNGGTLTTGSTGLTHHRTYSGDTYLPSAVTQTEHSNGPAATKYGDTKTDYTSASSKGYWDHGTARLARPLPSASKQYATDEVTVGGASSTDYNETTYAYTYHQVSSVDTWRVKTVTTTLPVVTSGTNGSNSADTTVRYMDELGRTIFTKDELAKYTWTGFDADTGQVTTQVNDPNSGTTGASSDASTWSISLPGGGLERTTSFNYDEQGRQVGSILQSGRVTATHYTKLADGRLATVSTPAITTSGGTYYWSPAGYTVTNLAGRQEASGTIAFTSSKTSTGMSAWIDETKSDVVQAVATGTLERLSGSTYDYTGTRSLASTGYDSIGSTVGGSTGDTTTTAYDSMGRVQTVTDATGTIDKSVYDAIGRRLESWTGTVDGGGGDDMTKIADMVYDGGGVGNSLVTLQTAYIQNSTTGRRDTAVTYDYRGRARYTQAAAAPHSVTLYDNLGRGLTTSLYSSTTSLTGTTNPTSSASNRVARSDRAYDARGRVWKSTRHEIIQSGGSAGNSNATLDQLSWFDPVGRLVKSVGPQVTKVEYDRLGREVRRFILGTNNDSTYADADDVSGDVVAEESHTTYDATTGLPIIQANIRRHPNASTSSYGALYNTTPGTSYSYSNITGRISISANYYDELDRQTDTASYGTAGITVSAGSWSYAGSVPSRSATILITSNTYGADGSVVDVTDPMGRITRTEYDNHGHRTKVTKNYVDGTAGGGTNHDEDQITNYTYSNGLMDSMTVDVATKSSQTTIYGYGVARGSGGNLVSSNRLMFKEEFPGSVSGSDKTVFAYNAQGQRIKRTDAGGNIIDTSYDVLGRETSRVASTVGSGFDTGTRAIATAYLARGMRDTITSYSNTGMSTETNQVQYSYDGWGNMVTFNQDVDGAIGAGGVAARSVSYTYDNVAPTGGILGLQRASMTMPNGTVLDYKYPLTETMGRVVSLTYDGITLVEYSYLGAGTVAETTLDEPGAFTSIFASGSTTYPYIDNFGRVTEDYWLRIGGSNYTDGLLDHDRNGNILAWTDELTKVQISGGTHDDHLFDSVYTNDGLNRLVKADEGKMTGSVGSRSIASAKHTRIEEFTLEQTGNWANQKLDLNGDGDQSDSGEKNWNNSHNIVNAITAWGAYSPGYDAVGNMTDDGRSYKYIYDGFNRLVKVTTRGGSPATVAEYKYNGLGYRIAWHYDADLSSAVDGSDPWYYFIYDERWRIMATYRGTDSTPKEQFVYHAAGAAGHGGSSYIDSVILRDSDDPEGWTNAADGVLETRHYILQNWRADVVALIDPSGDPFEYIRYSPYGVPFVYGAGDVDRNGQVDAFDPQTLSDFNSYGTGGLVVDHDINRDGVVDSADDTLVNDQSNWAIWSQGRGSLDRLGLRKGYAGYEWDPSTSLNHVRHRAYHAEMGRWTQRDPAGYVDGGDLYEYVGGRAVTSNDASGLMRLPCSGSGCTASQPVPAPDPQPRDCVNETSFNNCIACCFARNGGSACIGICLSKINPGDASYPTPVEGPPDSRAEVCAKACAALDSPSGSVACFGGKAIACVCATRSPTGPNAPSGTAQCIATHELINAEMYDCSSGEPLMRKGVGPIQLVCNEAMAYEAAVACLSGKQCEGTPRQRCMCEASKTALTSEWGCRAAFLRGKCTGSKIPTPGEQDDAYGACAASAISIRMGAEAACPK